MADLAVGRHVAVGDLGVVELLVEVREGRGGLLCRAGARGLRVLLQEGKGPGLGVGQRVVDASSLLRRCCSQRGRRPHVELHDVLVGELWFLLHCGSTAMDPVEM
jgi:hypothetical protein